MKFRSASEAAAAFLSRGTQPTYRRARLLPQRRRPEPPRITMNFARATVEELLDCVSVRINDCHARGVEPEHITNIAWQMLNDALRDPMTNPPAPES